MTAPPLFRVSLSALGKLEKGIKIACTCRLCVGLFRTVSKLPLFGCVGMVILLHKVSDYGKYVNETAINMNEGGIDELFLNI